MPVSTLRVVRFPPCDLGGHALACGLAAEEKVVVAGAGGEPLRCFIVGEVFAPFERVEDDLLLRP